ncbi:hypothetical protein IEQ34_010461 [Dendrobium chrysotoxum]|uniref:Growth-regulating factor n=1 Tax=Dendrobium chrysotoxum TaxID=161865 RepID=A0AAV7GVY0_DENCH|nr:hypothetical protein IEQ34_010461 [Dendrobium chrysotoxum]
MMSGRSSSRYPFTASQWQELEHQALIFKYMASGIPIPHDLIVPIRRSFLLDSTSTSPSLAFAPHTQLGWSCFQMGYGRKTEDPEPGRCRRTDGKKWRCSKEAYPDSKYCERHMHRGKNRSRKPVEISLATKTNHSSSSSSAQMSPYSANLSISTPETCHLLCPYPSSSVTSPFQLDSANYSDREYRWVSYVRFIHIIIIIIFMLSCISFIESKRRQGAERRSSSEFKPQWMSSMAKAKQNNYSLSKEEEEERQRPLRHFFDECPERNKDQWMDLEDESSSYTKTQLSISFPKWFENPHANQ